MTQVKTPPRIFIVEDEMLLAQILSLQLQQLGYTVTGTAMSADEAIAEITADPPDLVLMDIAIQGECDGIETATQLRDLPEVDVAVVFLTAYADDETLERAEAAGSYGYLLKPIQERELHATIKIALKQHQQAQILRQLASDAEASRQAKSNYLSMASHDLRNPLAAIQLSADMLKAYDERWDATRKARYFERIQRSISSINHMLEEVSFVGKAESGQMPFIPQSLDIVAFCQQILDEFAGLAQNHHQLRFRHRGDLVSPYLDKILLRHILANLLINAIKYSPNGGTVELNLRSTAEGVEIRVSDCGIGIPEADLPTLFDRYQRASNVKTIKGTGLGLHITQQAVERHGGTISVQSVLDKGTTFVVTLPQCPQKS